MHDFWLSTRIALRSLLKQRRFTFLAVSTLALGMAITTTFFSVFDTVLLRPLAYGESERLVTVLLPGRAPTSPANFVDLRDRSTTLEDLTAAWPWQPVLRGEGPAEQLSGLQSSADLFDLLGVEPLIGRTYSRGGDDGRVMVLGYELWQQRFGGEKDVLGRQVNLNGQSVEIIGVMPEGFMFPPFWATEARFWSPFDDPDMWGRRQFNALRVFGRLAERHDLGQAQSEVNTITAALAAEYPDENANLSYVVEPMAEPAVESIRPALQTILVGVGLVLLIACANVGGLWLTRTAGRAQELAIRQALGARGWVLWRQGLAESLLVVTLAAGCGWLLALWGLEVLKAWAPVDVPRLVEASLDGRVFLFTLAVALLLALGFALILPTAGRLSESLAGGNRRLGDRKESRSRSVLVAGEIAMALMLLLTSGLMGRSLYHLWTQDPGLRTDGVLTIHLPFGGTDIEPPDRQNPFFDRLLGYVSGLPGVERAALINHLHLGGDIWGGSYEVEGQPVENISLAPNAAQRVVSEGLFESFEIALLDGRGFQTTDADESQRVVVVSRSLAERHWPGESAVGKRLRDFSEERPWMEVVGVVEDVRQWSLTSDMRPTMYFPYRQNPVSFWPRTSLVVTTDGSPAALLPVVAQGLREFAPELPVSQARTLDDIYRQLLWQPRFSASLLSVFALAAILLAAIGVYGAMSFAAAARRRELGVRMALGANRGQLLRLLVVRSSASTLWGLGLGLAGAILLGGFLEAQLHGVSPHDPTTMAGTVLCIGFVALLAAYFPAASASRSDPVASLRQD